MRGVRRIAAGTLLWIALPLFVACDQAGPTAPTSTPGSRSTIPIYFTFDADFYAALVYDAHDNPGDLSYRRSRVFDLDSIPNFYIRRRDFRDLGIRHMEREIPRLVEELTGKRYGGRVLVGDEDRDRTGWITIVAATLEERPDLEGTCGLAHLGANPGRIWLNADPSVNRNCDFPETFAHELGHAMGLHHVPQGHGYTMANRESNRSSGFTVKEWEHARHAYKRGRGARHCGTRDECAVLD